MKANQDLKAELAKLKELAPTPLDQSFLLGYLAYGLPSTSLPSIRSPLANLLSLCHDGLITPINVLQLLTILRFKLLTEDPKEGSRKLVAGIDSYVGELALDNGYLQNRYFVEREAEKDLGLGECPICVQTIDYTSLCLLSCGHMLHKDCFNSYADIKIAAKIFPMVCPLETCLFQIPTSELSEFLSPQLSNKYTQFTFQQYVDKHLEDTSWCPTPGCKAVFAFDAALTNYRCPACKKHYCLRCKCQMHIGLSCEEYQSMAEMSEEDRRFMVLVKGAKYKQCPNCRFWVEKNEGCDHMTCRCKYEFCYICGGKYGSCSCHDREVQRNDDISDVDSHQQFGSIDLAPLRNIDREIEDHYLPDMEPGIMPLFLPIPPKFEEIPMKEEREHELHFDIEEKKEINKSIGSEQQQEVEKQQKIGRKESSSHREFRQQQQDSEEIMLKKAIQMSLQIEPQVQEKREVKIQMQPIQQHKIPISSKQELEKKYLSLKLRMMQSFSRNKEQMKNRNKQREEK